MYLKWKGYDEITPRWRTELLAESSNPELLAEVARAVQDAQERRRAEKGSAAEDDAPLAEELVPPPPEPTYGTTLLPRSGRNTRFAGSYFSIADVAPELADDLSSLEKQLREYVHSLYFLENSYERIPSRETRRVEGGHVVSGCQRVNVVGSVPRAPAPALGIPTAEGVVCPART